MAYLIDSDILIYSLKSHPTVAERFRRESTTPKAISIISFGELMFGAKKSSRPEKNTAVVLQLAELFPIIEVNRAVIEIFADLKVAVQRKGAPIDDMDLLIGATALSLNYVVVTNNEKHFSKIPGLEIENWTRLT